LRGSPYAGDVVSESPRGAILAVVADVACALADSDSRGDHPAACRFDAADDSLQSLRFPTLIRAGDVAIVENIRPGMRVRGCEDHVLDAHRLPHRAPYPVHLLTAERSAKIKRHQRDRDVAVLERKNPRLQRIQRGFCESLAARRPPHLDTGRRSNI